MNKFTFAALATTILVSASVKAGYQDFVLVNSTRGDILSIYTSPTGVEDWEEDILGDNTLDSGESLTITFSGRSERFWDIKIVYAGEEPDAAFCGIDLGSAAKAILWNNLRGETMLTCLAANSPSANRPALVSTPGPRPWPVINPLVPTPGPSPVIDRAGSRICPGCHGTGSCPACHGTGSYSNYGVSVPCDTKCHACGGTGRY